MAEPTTRFRLIPQSTAVADINTPAKRLAAIAGQSIVATGVGSEVDFGEIDISSGAENSGVKTILWDITDDGGNTLCQTFKLWLSDNGFDIAASVLKVQPLRGNDEGAGPWNNTEQYIVNGVVGSYTWATSDESVPGAINVWPSDEGSSMSLPGTNGASDDVVMWAWYLAIANGETTGIYKGTDAGYEIQFSFKYSYS